MSIQLGDFSLPLDHRLPRRITCECGASISRSSLSGHRRTKRHVAFVLDFVSRECKRYREQEMKDRELREQKRKREEEERVARRGLPTHITDIVFTSRLSTCPEIECGICYESISRETVFITKCGHIMCRVCEKKLYDNKTTQCPECRSDF